MNTAKDREVLEREARVRFLEERRKGVGGSDVAAILGLDPNKTAVQVWEEKVFGGDDETNFDIRRGRRLESWAAEEVANATGLHVREHHETRRGEGDWDHAIGHVDLLATPPKVSPAPFILEGDGVVEIKCPRYPRFRRYKEEGSSYPILYQALHYQALFGLKWALHAPFHPDYGVFPIWTQYDEVVVADMMERTRHFWTEYVLKEKRPPDPEPVENLPEIEASDIIVDDSEEWGALLAEYREASDLSKLAEKTKKEVSGLVREYIEKKEVKAIRRDGTLVHRISKKGKELFQKEALRKAKPLDRNSVALMFAGLIEEVEKSSGADLTDVREKLVDWLANAEVDLSSKGPFVKIGKPSVSIMAYWPKEKK